MAKLNHEREVFRLKFGRGSEPHWSGFPKPKQSMPTRQKKRAPDPRFVAERLNFMERCLFALESGNVFPPVPRRLRISILVNRKIALRTLILAWIGRQEDFRMMQNEVRLRISQKRLKKNAKEAAEISKC